MWSIMRQRTRWGGGDDKENRDTPQDEAEESPFIFPLVGAQLGLGNEGRKEEDWEWGNYYDDGDERHPG